MAPVTRSRVSVPSAAKNSCSTCKTPFDNPLGTKHDSAQRMEVSRAKIILRVKTSCATCKEAFRKPLARKTRSYWTKKKFQGWAEIAPTVAANRVVLSKKRHIVKFHRGTTLVLRHEGRVSTLRIPNRWTCVY